MRLALRVLRGEATSPWLQLNILNASQVQAHVRMNAICENVTPHNVVKQLFLMLESATNIIVQH